MLPVRLRIDFMPSRAVSPASAVVSVCCCGSGVTRCRGRCLRICICCCCCAGRSSRHDMGRSLCSLVSDCSICRTHVRRHISRCMRISSPACSSPCHRRSCVVLQRSQLDLRGQAFFQLRTDFLLQYLRIAAAGSIPHDQNDIRARDWLIDSRYKGQGRIFVASELSLGRESQSE